jgi:hypothetical protein
MIAHGTRSILCMTKASRVYGGLRSKYFQVSIFYFLNNWLSCFDLIVCLRGLYMKQVGMQWREEMKGVQRVVHNGRHSQYQNSRHIFYFICTWTWGSNLISKAIGWEKGLFFIAHPFLISYSGNMSWLYDRCLHVTNSLQYIREKELAGYDKLGQNWWLINAIWDNCKRV